MSRRDIDDAIQRRVPGTWPLRMLARAADDPLTAGGMLVVLLASATIISNALLLQTGRHPAPLFKTRPFSADLALANSGNSIAAKPLPSTSLVRDIQMALVQKGMYRGPVDGLAGPMTTQAIAGFERATGQVVTGAATPQLLARLQMTAGVPATDKRQSSTPVGKPSGPDASTTASADNRISQIQVALNNLGYGPLEVDGLIGSATAKAIRRFELNRGLPITGKISDRVVTELVSIGGLPRQ